MIKYCETKQRNGVYHYQTYDGMTTFLVKGGNIRGVRTPFKKTIVLSMF